MTMPPFPAICPAPLRSYGPGHVVTAGAFFTQFRQGSAMLDLPLQLSWSMLHHLTADEIWAHQRQSRGSKVFQLPSAAWGDDHPEVSSEAWWRYAPGGGISQSPATTGGAFVSISVSLILATS